MDSLKGLEREQIERLLDSANDLLKSDRHNDTLTAQLRQYAAELQAELDRRGVGVKEVHGD